MVKSLVEVSPAMGGPSRPSMRSHNPSLRSRTASQKIKASGVP